MSIRVITRPKNRISINTQQQSQIKTVGVAGAGGSQYLTQLKDIDASDMDNNETIVYDEASGKFIVKELPVINGGTF